MSPKELDYKYVSREEGLSVLVMVGIMNKLNIVATILFEIY